MGTALDLPDDIDTLKRLVIELRSQLERLKGERSQTPTDPPRLSIEQLELTLDPEWAAHALRRERPSPAMLARILVAKYAGHVPLHRQSRLYARAGVRLDRSTLASWVSGAYAVLEPLIETLSRYVLAGSNLHASDMPYPVRASRTGKARMGRLWAYVRDERAWGGARAAAVMFRFTPDRKARHPRVHLAGFGGVLHTGEDHAFDRVFGEARIQEAASWSPLRKRFFDLHEAEPSEISAEALERLDALRDIESTIRGSSAAHRLAARKARAAPLVTDLRAWLDDCARRLPAKSAQGATVRATLARWGPLTRYLGDGRIDADNEPAERALKSVALTRRSHLFAGADSNGERAAGVYSLIVSAMLNERDPEEYLREALSRIAQQPISRLDELLPGMI